MSDEPESEALVPSDNSSDSEKRPRRTYSLEEKIIALLNVDANAGNIHRTALALEIPYATLAGWDADRRSGKLQNGIIQNLTPQKEKRGDLAGKIESVLHSLVEAMAGKIPKATLSQTAVATGILTDKLRILRGSGLDPDPAAELCRLLNLNRSQLPERLELGPGDTIPPELFAGPVIETKPSPDNPDSFEPEPINPGLEAHSPDCSISPDIPDSCSCGADDRNAAKLKAQDETVIAPASAR